MYDHGMCGASRGACTGALLLAEARHVVTAHQVPPYIDMAYIVMVCTVMGLHSYGLYTYGLYGQGLYSYGMCGAKRKHRSWLRHGIPHDRVVLVKDVDVAVRLDLQTEGRDGCAC